MTWYLEEQLRPYLWIQLYKIFMNSLEWHVTDSLWHYHVYYYNYLDHIVTVGIVSNEDDSLFFYDDDDDWDAFYRPQYSPLFGPVFASPELEEKAQKLCKNDSFCLYDIAATGREEIGMTTLKGSEDFEELVETISSRQAFSLFQHVLLMCTLSIYCVTVVCNPPCQNGACVDSNTCCCSEGYIGHTCDIVGKNTNLLQSNSVYVNHHTYW